MTQAVWKIRQKSTGLFAKGGSIRRSYGASWNAKGKNWNELHHVKRHMANNLGFYRANKDDFEIVKLELIETENISGVQFFEDLDNAEAEKECRKKETAKAARTELLKRQKANAEAELARMGIK